MRKRYYIVQGDLTSHGGVVTGGDPSTTIDGIPVARFGDPGYCPLCKRPFVIVEALADEESDDKGMVVEGMRVSCGAVLIAGKQSSMYHTDLDVGDGMQEIATGLSADRWAMFDDLYVIRDRQTGKPLPRVEYAIRRGSGEIEYGVTDATGKTHLLSATADRENITVYVEG